MYTKLQTIVDRLNHVVQEGVTAIRAVKAFVRGEYEEEKFDAVNTDLSVSSEQTFPSPSHLVHLLPLPIDLLFQNIPLYNTIPPKVK